jgi:16S rRNA (cytosine967-C5)-methyltransferase
LAKKHGFTPLSGFVNGVLRNIARQPNEPAIPPDHFSLRYSYPDWLADSLADWLGTEKSRDFFEKSHQPPSMTIFVNTNKITPAALSDRLRAEGLLCAPGAFHPECLSLRNTGDIASLASFKEGLFFVMDEGAVFAVKSLGLQPGSHFIDVCAAPGGKTFAAACLMEDKGRIQAFDLHRHRVDLLCQSAKRLGFTSIEAAQKDASVPEGEGNADAVLVDAPCSGLGILRKQPDIKFSRKPEDMAALACLQRELLAAAASHVKPGGTLVYCTCTVARPENHDIARWFTEKFPFTPVMPYVNSLMPTHFFENTYLQLLPGPDNDAFFISKWVRDA